MTLVNAYLTREEVKLLVARNNAKGISRLGSLLASGDQLCHWCISFWRFDCRKAAIIKSLLLLGLKVRQDAAQKRTAAQTSASSLVLQCVMLVCGGLMDGNLWRQC